MRSEGSGDKKKSPDGGERGSKCQRGKSQKFWNEFCTNPQPQRATRGKIMTEEKYRGKSPGTLEIRRVGQTSSLKYPAAHRPMGLRVTGSFKGKQRKNILY